MTERRPYSVGVTVRVLTGAALALLAIGPAAAQSCAMPTTTSPDEIIAKCSKLLLSRSLAPGVVAGAHVDRGNAYVRKGDYDHALEDYDAATRANPRDPVPFFNRGSLYETKRDPERAMQEFDEAIRLNPKYINARIRRSNHYRTRGQYDRALQDSVAALQVDPNNVFAYVERGFAYAGKKDFDAALKDANEAIRLRPNYHVAHALRGMAHFNKGEFQAALADFSKSVEIEPKYAFAHYWRGEANLNLKNNDQAIADFTSSLDFGFDPALAHEERGRAYFQKGATSNAVVDYNEAIRLAKPNPAYYFNRGLALRKTGDVEGAVRDFTDSIRVDDTYLLAYTARGQAYEALGKVDLARKDFTAAAALPVKRQYDKSASDTAKARLAVLGGGPPGLQSSSLQPTNLPPNNPSPVAVGNNRRMALIVGNSAYRTRALANPVNDARAMSEAFRKIGFEVVDGFDLDYTNMRRVLSQFVVQAANAQIAVVYYAGHGIQAQGHNYLVPTDAKMESERAANFELFDLDQIIATLDDPARTTVIILDACRSNPFTTQMARTRGAEGKGLAGYTYASQGMLIAFATAPGKVAEDGDSNHSPFTGALLKYITTPNLEILDLFRNVRQSVIKETGGRQVPWEQDSLVGELFLAGGSRKGAVRE